MQESGQKGQNEACMNMKSNLDKTNNAWLRIMPAV
jgi:hypothetical protein